MFLLLAIKYSPETNDNSTIVSALSKKQILNCMVEKMYCEVINKIKVAEVQTEINKYYK